MWSVVADTNQTDSLAHICKIVLQAEPFQMLPRQADKWQGSKACKGTPHAMTFLHKPERRLGNMQNRALSVQPCLLVATTATVSVHPRSLPKLLPHCRRRGWPR